jgi:hypothetical protein
MHVYAGEPYCPSCTSYVTTPQVELVSLADPLDDPPAEATRAMVDGVNAAMKAAHPLPDLQDVPDAEAGYLDWLREREQCEEWHDLMEWARQTLTCAPLPCTCLRTLRCLRCRVAALVEGLS